MNFSLCALKKQCFSTKDISKGLDYDYITQWSYGFFETFNLFIPRIVGGGSSEELGKNSSFYKFLVTNGYNNIDALNIVKNSPTYWGDQPFVEAPAYIGIAVFFLFVFCQTSEVLGCVVWGRRTS